MNRRILAVLGALLGAQLLLGVALNAWPWTQGNNTSALKVPVDDPAIDRIEISSKTGTLKLVLRDGQWLLPDHYNLPAVNEAVKLVRDRLGKLDGGTPVATSSEARKRFRVTDDDFERRIIFFSKDSKRATVWLGSPGTRNRSHLRVDGNDGIFEEAIAAYEWRTDPEAWLDKSLLRVPREQLAAIRVAGLTLRPEAVSASGASAPAASAPAASSVWQAQGVPAGHSLSQAAANALADAIAQLNYEFALGTEVSDDWGLAKPMLQFEVERKQGGTRSYRLGKLASEDAYALQASDRKEVFKLLAYQAKPLIDAARAEQLATKNSR